MSIASPRQSFLDLIGFIAKVLSFSFLFFFILFPSCFVLIFLVRHRVEIMTLFSNPAAINLVFSALVFSLKIAVFVSVVSLILGFPFAWFFARGRFPGGHLFESLTTLPLALPTSALGFSAATFWLYTNFSLSLFWFISLVHFAFTFPFVVGVLGTALKKDTASLENAATMLGAPKLTVIRTIIFPQIKLEASTAFLFCFARSLSETGATVVALTVFGASQLTAPALIAQQGSGLGLQAAYQEKILLAAVISGILIILSLSFFWLLRFLTKQKGVPIFPKLINLEANLNVPLLGQLKNLALFTFLFFVVLLPSFFIINRAPQVQSLDFYRLGSSLILSFMVAILVTIINLAVGTPMARYLSRSQSSHFYQLFNFLIDIPLIVPTVALGFSLGLYWRSNSFVTLDILLIVFAHLAFTYPYVVRILHDAFVGLRQEFIDASRSLGASPFNVFKTIILPLLAPAFATAFILVFARSLGETGATMAVTDKVLTAPVYIVDLVETGHLEQAGIASAALVTISFLLFVSLRRIAFLLKS